VRTIPEREAEPPDSERDQVGGREKPLLARSPLAPREVVIDREAVVGPAALRVRPALDHPVREPDVVGRSAT